MMGIDIANGWRGEVSVEVPGHTIILRCRMDVLANIMEALKCDTLVDLTRSWDGLNPNVMQTSLKLFAESPSDAEAFFPHVDGLRGLEQLHQKFYVLISGMNPKEIAEDQEARKKLALMLEARSTKEITQIVKALNLT